MASTLTLLAATLVLPLLRVSAVGTNDQVNADIDYGSFQNPSVNVRPRFRYWVPDASVNSSQVAEDVKEAGIVGAGGVELLGYYLYGDIQLFPGNYDALQSDWTMYGFGSSAWKELLDTVLSTAQENGLLVDLALGPNQGAGVPAPYDSDGLLWDLDPYDVSIPLGGSYEGVLPGWNSASGPLVAASTGLVLSVDTFASGGSNITLSQSSLNDITGSISKNGSVSVSFPSNGTQTGVEYRLFAYYLKHSDYPEVEAQNKLVAAVPQSPITTYEQNGSWVVDHFSALGAQTTIDFWEQNLVDDSTKSLIKEVGNYVWEDSEEFYLLENTFWTPDLPSVFLANRGYSVNVYVPLLMNTLSSSTTNPLYVLDKSDFGSSHVADYRQTLTELNQVYLQTLANWSQEELGIEFSAQVVYNLPMDMLANIPYVNGPECETLAFGSNVDAYKQFSGPANLAGKRIVSSELGALYNQAYQSTIPELLYDLKKSFAGSVNQFILHGFPYSGNYGNTTWPGFTTFDYTYSEMHGRHQPGWDFYSDFLNWTSRTQWFAQTGIPKMDIVFWSKSTDYRQVLPQYTSTDLLEAGFSYEYLSPDNFALPEAYVTGGIFAPERQAFKVMVIRASETLTGLGVTSLVQYAQNGLPIIFLGGLPTQFEGYDQTGYTTANSTISNLTSLENVHVTAADDLADTLISLNITPRTAVSTNGTWYTYWREDNRSSTEYVYIFNDAGTPDLSLGQGFSTGNVTFESTGVPYFYDAWTGAITPCLVYEYSAAAGTTTIPLQLAGDQTIIIAFVRKVTRPFHVQSVSSSALSVTSKPSSSSISVLSGFTSTSTSCTLSNGTSITLPPMLTAPFILANWSITVESWTSPTDPYDLSPIATRTNLSTFISLPSLAPWTDISPSFTNVSGRGYYSTSFQWPPQSNTTSSTSAFWANTSTTSASSVDGAFIDLGHVFHTARVIINDNTLPPLDTTCARADISPYLVNGTNTIYVVVSTPLGNALRPLWDSIESSGKVASAGNPNVPAVADYGLIFPVQVLPFREDRVGT